MFSQLDNILKEKTDEVVFIELKESAIEAMGDVKLPTGTPVPFMTRDMVSKVSGNQGADISLPSIMEAMVRIMGIDTAFPYKEAYMAFLKSIDADFKKRILADALALAQAEEKLNAVVRLRAYMLFDARNLDALYNLARLCEELAIEHEKDENIYKQFTAAARQALETCIEVDNGFALAGYHLGFHYVNDQAYGRAEAIWAQAMKSDTLTDDQKVEIINTLRNIDAKLEYEKGYKLVIEGFSDEGLEHLSPLLEDYPEWWNLMFFVGLAYRQKEMYDEALHYYKQSLNLNTGHVDTMNEIGICYMTMGHFDEAERYFKEALKVKPKNNEILCNLGIVHIQRGEYYDALDKIEESVKLDPEDEVSSAWLRQVKMLIEQEGSTQH
ncbi:tetratricopeptide repeat protein [Fusibacter sp. JL216-2]|uniref:tetratricopeptide repeat protein n=1 Tax=Fusibacter sp. JL216-2 TaxID=3071453 RepID=UPI003D3565BD